MAESLPPLSEAQAEIMNVVWDRGEATVAAVWKALSTGRPVARNTVQTMIARLEEKGWLRRIDGDPPLRYAATCARPDALRGLLRRLVDTTFRGSVEGLVNALLDGRRLSRAEARRLRRMIDEAGSDGP